MDSLNNLEKHVNLSEVTRKYIQDSFFLAAGNIDEEEFRYIQSKIYKKILCLKDDFEEWISELAFWYKVLYEVSECYFSKAVYLAPDSIKKIGAALFYFLNPYDIIPDKEIQGYTDDLFVLLVCISSLPEAERNTIFKHAKKKRNEPEEED